MMGKGLDFLGTNRKEYSSASALPLYAITSTSNANPFRSGSLMKLRNQCRKPALNLPAACGLVHKASKKLGVGPHYGCSKWSEGWLQAEQVLTRSR